METEYRRKAPRRDFDGKVGALFKGEMTITQCSQLGEGGALITEDKNLKSMKEGDPLVLTLFLVNIGPVIATAECVYRSSNGKIGLQFRDLDTRYKKLIREFVSRRKIREGAA